MRWARESRSALGLALLGLVLVSLSAARGASPTTPPEPLRHQQSSLAARSHQALLRLYALDSRLARARAELGLLKSRAQALRLEQEQVRYRTCNGRSNRR